MILAAETDIWRYQTHPEVWVLVAGAILLAWYSIRVIGPNAVAPGEPLVRRRNIVAYVAAIVALWGASDWPMHDISEEYLYSVHMIQHLIISFIVPPLLLVATPEWLARLIMSPSGRALGAWIRRFANPVTAGVIFNVVVAVTHLTTVVNTSVENGIFHYTVHLAVFSASLMMWIPVIGPIKELRISYPGQMVYLFLMSVIPTIPAGFLTFADGAIYDVYDHQVRLWGIDISTDQQMAGLIMKLAGGIYLWSWIIVRFYQWNNETRGSQELVLVTGEVDAEVDAGADELTFEDIQAQFDRTDPAPSERA